MLRKTYLSREVSRAMSRMGEPIGDPFGGPAYGEKRDPVTIGAAFSVVFAGTAGVAAVATVVATVGVGMTVVGVITGNKTLVKVGGVLSLVGGITGIAASSGMLGAEAAAEMAALSSGGAGVATGAASAESQAMIEGSAQMMADQAPGIAAFQATSMPVDVADAFTSTQGVESLAQPTAAPTSVPAAPVSTAPASPTTLATPPASSPGTLSPQVSGAPTFRAAGANPLGVDLVNAPAAATPAPLASGAAGPSTDFWSLEGMKKLFSGPSGGYAIQGIAKLGGDALQGYATGQASQQKLDAERGLLSQQIYNRGFAGRVA